MGVEDPLIRGEDYGTQASHAAEMVNLWHAMSDTAIDPRDEDYQAMFERFNQLCDIMYGVTLVTDPLD